MWEKIKMLVKDEEGATMAEYAILISLIAIVAITAVTDVGKGVEAVFNKVKSSLPTPAQ